MKTICTFAIFMFTILGYQGLAQVKCPGTIQDQPNLILTDRSVVGDFTITDSDGNTYNLYNTLNEGKTVFIDMFYTTCSYCIMYAPIIEATYQATGAGQGNVVFWGLSPTDNNQNINTYKVAHNVTNPCAGTQGNGPAALNIVKAGQPFNGYPTYCVICPDKTLQFDVCYPPTLSCMLGKIGYCATILFPIFSPENDTVFTNHPVSFTDASTGNPTSWLWTFEGGTPETSTEKNPVVTYQNEGAYDVSLTVSDGSFSQTVVKTDLMTVLSNVGIPGPVPDLFSISPNPVTDNLHIQLNEPASGGTITILNLCGIVLFTEPVPEKTGFVTTINIAAYGKGTYFIKVVSNGNSGIKKVIVQ